MKASNINLHALGAFSKKEDLHVIIETPKGSRNKYTYEEKYGLFVLKKVLPEGMSFPYDFGFVPATKGGDGDPLDILVLMDEPAFPGCFVKTRLLGVIEAEQTEKGKTLRNDRLIGVAIESAVHASITDISELDSTRLEQIQHFFIAFNQAQDKEFKPLAVKGPKEAKALVKQSMKAFEKGKEKKGRGR